MKPPVRPSLWRRRSAPMEYLWKVRLVAYEGIGLVQKEWGDVLFVISRAPGRRWGRRHPRDPRPRAHTAGGA